MVRVAGVVCAVVACGLLAWAGVLALRPPPDPPPSPGTVATTELTVENAEQDLGAVPAGEHRVVFRVANRTDRPGAWVGGTTGCQAGSGCCLYFREATRVPVPPGETAEVGGLLAVGEGPFEYDGWLYLDEGGALRTARFKLTGVGVAPEGKSHAPAP